MKSNSDSKPQTNYRSNTKIRKIHVRNVTIG